MAVKKAIRFSLFIAIFSMQVNNTNCAYPMERVIANMTGAVPSKTWIIFMERRPLTCLYGASLKTINNLFSILRCLTYKYDHKGSCVYSGKYGLTQTYCFITKREPNILTYAQTGILPLMTLKVHGKFNLNVTVIRFQQNADSRQLQRLMITDGSIRQSYSGRHLPWTVLSKTNFVVVEVFDLCHLCVVIEYGITSAHEILQNNNRLTPSSTYFSWASFYIHCLYIRVELIARIAVFLMPSNAWKIKVYDGPSGLLPVIKETSGILRNTHRVTSSTFHVFVIVIFHNKSEDTTLRYEPKTVTKTIKLTNDQKAPIRFDNLTDCHSHTLYARLCVFHIMSSTSRNLKITLTKLKFLGVYSGSMYTAGAAIFDIINSKSFLIYELYDNNWVTNDIHMNFYSSQNQIYFVVYSYLVYASIESEIIVSQIDCTSLYFDMSSSLYSQHLNHTGGKRIDWYTTDISWETETIKCIRLQPLENYRFDFKETVIGFKFKHNLVAKYVFRQHGINLRSQFKFCPFSREVTTKVSSKYNLYNNMHYEEGTAVFKYLTVEFCHPLIYYDIQFTFIGCTLPCKELGIEAFNTHRLCDICRMHYTGKNHKDIYIPSNSMFDINILSRQCTSLILTFCRLPTASIGLCYGFGVRKNMTIQVPKFQAIKTIALNEKSKKEHFRCSAEIPLTAFTFAGQFPEFEIAPNINPKYWGQYLYILMTSRRSLSWNAAASTCKSYHGHLLTIYSQREYEFLAKTFLVHYDTSLLYIGSYLKVIISWPWLAMIYDFHMRDTHIYVTHYLMHAFLIILHCLEIVHHLY